MGAMSSSSTIMWFRDDLRINDNMALRWAANRGPVIGLLIDDTTERPGVRRLGGAARWWWQRSIQELAASLKEYGVPLLLHEGNPLEILPEVAQTFGAGAVTWTRRYHKPLRDVDAEIKTHLRKKDLEVHSHPGFLLTEPWEVSSGSGAPYKVYTPFSKTAFPIADAYDMELSDDFPDVLGGPETGGFTEIQVSDDPHWIGEMPQHCSPGEKSAQQRLSSFAEELQEKGGYAEGRDEMARNVTSRLSAHLRFGEISVHRVWTEINTLADTGDIDPEDAHSFLKELLWRDFAWHRLYALENMQNTNVREIFNRFGWAWEATEISRLTDGRHPLKPTGDDEFHQSFAAWRAGRTGIPLVDAGMRELWATGSMHNRSRMVVASFLTKNLQIHWRHGEEWFWETLVDADPASNSFNWQWAAGSGDDASPYFRIFNPETQAIKFDPDSEYIRRWVPEYGTPVYPEPIVDLKESRREALDAYEAIK